MTDSQTLLAEYARSGSESAFRELVTRYFGLVYSTALRLVGGDLHLAQDVAQMVFTDLARKAHGLSSRVMLGGWLHQRTFNIAAPMRRAERRRRAREREAVEMNAGADDSAGALAQIAPVLDEAITQLGQEDRTAILLRFFERRDFRSVGEALGTTDDAAQKRVTRALEKLHSALKHHGVTLSAAAVATGLGSEALTAAPAGLAGGIAGMALASAAAGGGITVPLVKLLAMTKLQAGVVGAILIACVAIPVAVQHQSRNQLREDNQALRQQVEQLAASNERLSNLLAHANSLQALAKDQPSEILRLRGEVGVLRQQKSEADMLREENRRLRAGLTNAQNAQATNPPTPLSALVPRESWAFAGYTTPEAALRTMVWAWSNRDGETLLASTTPEGRKQLEETFEGKSASEALAAFPVDLSTASGYQFRKKEVSDDEVAFYLSFDLPFHVAYGRDVTMKNVGGEWKAE